MAALVACFWYAEGAPGTPAKEKLLPSGEPCIIVNLRDDQLRLYSSGRPYRFDTYGFAMLSGPRTRPCIIDNQQQDRVFGIQFRAAGACPFVRFSAGDLEDSAVPLETVWRRAAGELRERLLAASGVGSMFRAAELILLAQAVRPLALHDAVRFSLESLHQSRHAGRISDISSQVDLSQRRFIEIFRSQVGLTPKAFCRVRRFQNVLRAVHPSREVDWAQVALENGYYDQAHFIHDFRAFSGLTPTQYWQSRTPHLNHVPLAQ